MKKILFFNFVLALVISTGQNSFAQRTAVWVHGVNSNNTWWANYAATFAGVRANLNSDNRTYRSDRMANMVTDIRNGAGRNNQHIYIGHSMGGVALRDLAINNPGHLGGIITVGSPLNGAMALNSLNNGNLERSLQLGIREIVAGPLSVGFVRFYVIRQGLSMNDAFNALNNVITDVQGAFGVAGRELQANSAYINTFENQNTGVPTLSIWGNENRPVHWRLASTEVFDNDTELPDIVSQIGDVYHGIYIAKLVTGGIGLFYNWFKAGRRFYQAIQWKRGRDYIRSRSESDWNNLIGATRTERQNRCRWDYACDRTIGRGPGQIGIYPIDDAIQFNCGYQQVCYSINVPINEPSDGLIHRTSQRGDGTRWARGNHENEEAEGANHQEQNDHIEVFNALNDAFNGDNQGIFDVR